jgi:flagellar biosynthesis/type III secretory pathway protein FliH
LSSAVARMCLSSLLRADNVALIRNTGAAPTLRVFGNRVLRGDHVGLQRPLALSAPVAPAYSAVEDFPLQLEELSPPPPDLSEIEEAARLQGFNVGFEQGHAEGIAMAEAALGDVLRRLSTLLSNVHENHTAFFRAAERQVVDLSLQIAQKVVEREVENMPDLAVSVIRSALEEMDARTAVRIRVSPDDAELLRRRWTQVVPSGIGADRIELQPDERVQPGGGIIETTHGQVDAQLESKLAQLGNALWTFVMDVNSAGPRQEDSDA